MHLISTLTFIGRMLWLTHGPADFVLQYHATKLLTLELKGQFVLYDLLPWFDCKSLLY
jgi:hypothetical protein